jgi:dephospho-CoA kinase
MIIVAIAGKKGSGKDTVAERLVQCHNFVKYSFADPLKEGCKAMFGFTDEQLWGKEKEVPDKHWGGVTPREVLQIIGTEIFQFVLPEKLEKLKDFGRYFWFHRFVKYLTKQEKDVKIVIPDLRFEHEVKALRELGLRHTVKILKITRTGLKDENFVSHRSEVEVDFIKDIDLIITNDGSKQDLFSQIDMKIDKLLKKPSFGRM